MIFVKFSLRNCLQQPQIKNFDDSTYVVFLDVDVTRGREGLFAPENELLQHQITGIISVPSSCSSSIIAEYYATTVYTTVCGSTRRAMYDSLTKQISNELLITAIIAQQQQHV